MLKILIVFISIIALVVDAMAKPRPLWATMTCIALVMVTLTMSSPLTTALTCVMIVTMSTKIIQEEE